MITFKEIKITAKIENPFIVDSLDIKVTDCCTMRCNYCATALDYYGRKTR